MFARTVLNTLNKTLPSQVLSRAARRQPSPVLCMSTPAKRKMVKIGTHSGTFHCDEALGCHMLRQTSQFANGEIVRSRDPEVLKDLDVVIDVGGVYDPASHRYDHHQREFQEVFGHGFACSKLSSAGLVYRHFGKEVLAKLTGVPADHPDMQAIYLQVYKAFIESVDASDNGVMPYDIPDPPKYLNNTTLQARVARLNPRWNESYTDEALYERFLKAVELTGQEFTAMVDDVAKSWLPGRGYVKEAIEQRFAVDPSGQIMKLNHYCPWKDHLYNLEQEMGVEKPILYCLYEDEREKKWRIQAVSVGPGSFQNRKSMPAAWRGLRDETLSSTSGIPGCVFVHASGFIGGNATYEGVLQMAQRSLAAAE